ncbi:hypothetical protein GWI33_022262 [Rhynchophorus ferrugineus]|uniref:Peptidase S1 domain-containing protein n=1 Tax=Rhynchophorus ferrugineus TaxID=354439 RepID=A0A834IQ01_RHYFE|nr:hypothetical protein GWI33_022262 [Rhynchophorus ferrugineus]
MAWQLTKSGINRQNSRKDLGPASIIDHPYQVLLMINGKPKCGGSIIRSNFILTAAHCIHNVKVHQLQIRAGSTDRTLGGQIREIQEMYYPDDKFNIDTYDFDIAILKLIEHLVFNEAVASIELPTPGREIKEHDMAKATGWGMTDPLESTLPKILQVVKLPQISTSSCRKYYGNLISERMFCAGYEEGGKDTCLGDSGGPLVANNTLVGITSWGGDICAQAGKPGVFTKISFFREFIDDIINNKII